MLRLIALLLLLAVIPELEQKVFDLTTITAEHPGWKIVEFRAGGSIGTSAHRPAHERMTVGLSDVSRRGTDLYFSIEIKNDGQLNLEIPVTLSSSAFDTGAEVIRFRELFISLGTSPDDEYSFKGTQEIEPVSLFGSPAVPGTTEFLSPGETLVIRLKTKLKGEPHDDLRSLRVKVSGSDVELTRTAAGYKQLRTFIPALSAMSKPVGRPDANRR